MWLRELHECVKPTATRSDQGHFWTCPDCRADWVVRHGTYTDCEEGRKDYFYFEEPSEKQQRALERHRNYEQIQYRKQLLGEK